MRPTTVKRIAAQLRFLKEQRRSCILFLGAGASRSAGIPLAGELSDILRAHPMYKDMVEDCEGKDYASLMGELNSGTRKAFLNDFILRSKLNQSHLYAAALMKAGYVDTVVTVNFDPLMLRALSVLNIYPSVYDMAISREFILGGIEHPAVVYLHGQSHGFWQLNTKDEMPIALENIRSLFSDITSSRSMIIVGYSGLDPVFKELSRIPKFEHGIYWVGYKDHEPLQIVKDELLEKPNKNPWFLPGLNSDEFFRELKNELKIEEPSIISKPFSFLQETVQIISEFEVGSQKVPWTATTLKWIGAAIEGFEEGKGFAHLDAAKEKNIQADKLVERLKEILDKETYNDVVNIEDDVIQSGNLDALEHLSYIYNDWGVDLTNKAKADENNERLFNLAFEKYKRAADINPGYYNIFYNWGTSLSDLAAIKNNDENLLREAFEKYKIATQIKPDYYEAFYNWGNGLSDLAKIRDNDKTVFREAVEKYKIATDINASDYEVFNNWGNTLGYLATVENNDETLFEEAFEKYKKSIELNPTNPKAFYNWANTLLELAKTKNNDEQLFTEAFEKYKNAIEIKPDYYDAFNNWGVVLSELAKTKNNDEQLFTKAFEKYKKATEINPEYYRAFYNWGTALADLAVAKNNDIDLLNLAFEKLQQAVTLEPFSLNTLNKLASTVSRIYSVNSQVALEFIKITLDFLVQYENKNPGQQAYNIACMYSLLLETSSSLQWLETAVDNEKLTREYIEADTDLKNLRDLPEFKALLDKYRPIN